MRRVLPLLLLLIANEARADPVLDGSWLDGSVAGNGTVNVTTSTITLTTSGPDRLIVAICGNAPFTGGVHISSVAGGGLAWTKRVSASSGGVWNFAEIWTASAPTQLTAQAITLTMTAPDSGIIMFHVAALTGHNIANPFGSSPASISQNAAPAVAASITITADAAGSLILGAWVASSLSGASWPALANTTYIRQIGWASDNENAAAGYLTSGPGAVTFGSATVTTNADLGAVALEILAAPSGATAPRLAPTRRFGFRVGGP
jgi:hypothetical protein